jgi:hypothetical protein
VATQVQVNREICIFRWINDVNTAIFIAVLLISAETAMAQILPSEVVGYEVSASWLDLAPRGNVQTNSSRVEFNSDLGLDGMQSQIGLWFSVKPWSRSGLFGEFIPYRFSGEQSITQSFRFGGVTYAANQPVTAKTTLNYLSFGYLHDVVSRRRIEGRWLAGVAYFGLSAKATSPSVGTNEVDRNIVLPVAGFQARYTPSIKRPFSLRGDLRGMTFGSYGSYVDVSGAFAFNLSQHIDLEAGYRVVDGDGHLRSRGAELIFAGPIVTFRMSDHPR